MGTSASTNAIIALVFGVLSFLGGGPVTGIVAWIIGRSEVQRIDAGISPYAGRGMAQAGMILGIIATAATGVVIVIWLGFVTLIGGAIAFSH